jgi:hypothetical protein
MAQAWGPRERRHRNPGVTNPGEQRILFTMQEKRQNRLEHYRALESA